MPLPAVVIVVASAAGGAFLWNAYEKAKEKKLVDDAARQNAVNKVASELLKGKSYAVQLMVDPANPTWGGINNLERASALIKATFEQLGWRLHFNPAPRDDLKTATQKLALKQPMEWVFNGTWMRDERYQTLSPGWVGMALPYLLPTT
jgi:hypothetical protein